MLSEHFHAYARLLYRLHELMANGQTDADEADQLRDRMDAPWAAMSADETALARVLSSDLYDLVEAPRASVDQPRTMEERERVKALGNAYRRGQYASILRNLRELDRFIPPHFSAYLRGKAWNGLGDIEMGRLFLGRASELAPSNVDYEGLVLDLIDAHAVT